MQQCGAVKLCTDIGALRAFAHQHHGYRARGEYTRYLERLAEAYARYFHDYAAAPLLIVNAAILDPVHNDAHFALLLAEIGRIRTGRHFFNPLASAFA